MRCLQCETLRWFHFLIATAVVVVVLSSSMPQFVFGLGEEGGTAAVPPTQEVEPPVHPTKKPSFNLLRSRGWSEAKEYTERHAHDEEAAVKAIEESKDDMVEELGVSRPRSQMAKEDPQPDPSSLSADNPPPPRGFELALCVTAPSPASIQGTGITTAAAAAGPCDLWATHPAMHGPPSTPQRWNQEEDDDGDEESEVKEEEVVSTAGTSARTWLTYSTLFLQDGFRLQLSTAHVPDQEAVAQWLSSPHRWFSYAQEIDVEKNLEGQLRNEVLDLIDHNPHCVYSEQFVISGTMIPEEWYDFHKDFLASTFALEHVIQVVMPCPSQRPFSFVAHLKPGSSDRHPALYSLAGVYVYENDAHSTWMALDRAGPHVLDTAFLMFNITDVAPLRGTAAHSWLGEHIQEVHRSIERNGREEGSDEPVRTWWLSPVRSPRKELHHLIERGWKASETFEAVTQVRVASDSTFFSVTCDEPQSTPMGEIFLTSPRVPIAPHHTPRQDGTTSPDPLPLRTYRHPVVFLGGVLGLFHRRYERRAQSSGTSSRKPTIVTSFTEAIRQHISTTSQRVRDGLQSFRAQRFLRMWDSSTKDPDPSGSSEGHPQQGKDAQTGALPQQEEPYYPSFISFEVNLIGTAYDDRVVSLNRVMFETEDLARYTHVGNMDQVAHMPLHKTVRSCVAREEITEPSRRVVPDGETEILRETPYTCPFVMVFELPPSVAKLTLGMGSAFGCFHGFLQNVTAVVYDAAPEPAPVVDSTVAAAPWYLQTGLSRDPMQEHELRLQADRLRKRSRDWPHHRDRPTPSSRATIAWKTLLGLFCILLVGTVVAGIWVRHLFHERKFLRQEVRSVILRDGDFALEVGPDGLGTGFPLKAHRAATPQHHQHQHHPAPPTDGRSHSKQSTRKSQTKDGQNEAAGAKRPTRESPMSEGGLSTSRSTSDGASDPEDDI